MARYKLGGGYGAGTGLVVNGANLDNQFSVGKLGGQTLLFGTASANNGVISSNPSQNGQVFFGTMTSPSYWVDTPTATGRDCWMFKGGKPSLGKTQVATFASRGNAVGDDICVGFGSVGYAASDGGASISTNRLENIYVGSNSQDLRWYVTVNNVGTNVLNFDGLLGITKHVRGLSFARASKSTTYPVTDGDTLILADGTGGAFDVTLPTAVGRDGSLFGVMRTSAAGTITIKSAGGTLNGVAAATGVPLTAQYMVRWYISDGTNWFAVMGLL